MAAEKSREQTAAGRTYGAHPRDGIAQRILAELAHTTPALVADFCVGNKYTAVSFADGRLGVALTQSSGGSVCCADTDSSQPARGVALWAGADALERRLRRSLSWPTSRHLLPLLLSADPLEAGVGLACANALVNRPRPEFVKGDLLDHLELHSADTVGMVGFFGPFVAPLRERVAVLHIFERKTDGEFLPAEAAYALLPGCDVAIITSAAISNGTIDRLLLASSRCREVALVGASTPLVPPAFTASPVTWLSGSLVADSERTFQVVRDGGGRREFSRYLTKVDFLCRW